MGETKNTSKFFANKECEYYPCHKMEGELNCLFCYCPMYFLEKCPGSYEIFTTKSGKQMKSCLNCTYPHEPEHYEAIMKILAKQFQ